MGFPRNSIRFVLGCSVVLGLALPGCDDDSGTAPENTTPIPTTDEFVFERHRDGVTGSVLPVLTESGSGFDAREVDSPAALLDPQRPDGDAYMLYYEAADVLGTARIALVTSANPTFATRVVDRTLVFDLGPGGSAYESGATDPTVVIERAGASHRYRMWFEGRSGIDGASSAILTAVSDDGLNWTDVSVCTGLEASFAPARIADPSVVVDGSTYRMWFEANGGSSGAGAIGYATSTDGIAWTVRDASGATGAAASAVFTARGGTAFDAAGVHAPCVVFDSSATSRGWMLWYEASDDLASTENTIGVATSDDGLNWTRLDAPVLTPSSDSVVPLPFDSGDIEHPMVLVDPAVNRTVRGHFLLYYTGDGEANFSPNRIGLAYGAEAEPVVTTP